ncbi:MAG: RDD family protein [Bdellovibrionota bacterium]
MIHVQEAYPTYRLANFKERLGAYAVDFLIIFALGMPFTSLVSVAEFLYSKMTLNPMAHYEAVFALLRALVGVAVVFLYVGYFYKKRSTTLGKSLFNLKVIHLPYGECPNYKTAFLRDVFGRMLSGLAFMVGYLMVLFKEDRRALHDHLADTVVLKQLS